MDTVLSGTGPPPKLWIVELVGHFEDVGEATQAVTDNQREVFIKKETTSVNDDVIRVIVHLELKDPTMILLVQSIIENDFPNVQIIRNGESENEGQPT